MKKQNCFLSVRNLLLTLLICHGAIQLTAQTVVTFTETMGTVAATTTIVAHEAANSFDNDGFTMSNGGATTPADIRNSSASSGYTGASGGANVFFSGTAGPLGFGIANIVTTGLTGLTLFSIHI